MSSCLFPISFYGLQTSTRRVFRDKTVSKRKHRNRSKMRWASWSITVYPLPELTRDLTLFSSIVVPFFLRCVSTLSDLRKRVRSREGAFSCIIRSLTHNGPCGVDLGPCLRLVLLCVRAGVCAHACIHTMPHKFLPKGRLWLTYLPSLVDDLNECKKCHILVSRMSKEGGS